MPTDLHSDIDSRTGRLQVRMPESQLEEIKERASSAGVSVSDWVRLTLRSAAKREKKDEQR